MSDHVFHQLGFVNQTRTIAFRHGPPATKNWEICGCKNAICAENVQTSIELNHLLITKSFSLLLHLFIILSKLIQFKFSTKFNTVKSTFCIKFRLKNAQNIQQITSGTAQKLFDMPCLIHCFKNLESTVIQGKYVHTFFKHSEYQHYLCGQPQFKSTPSEKGETTHAASARVCASFAANWTIKGLSAKKISNYWAESCASNSMKSKRLPTPSWVMAMFCSLLHYKFL